MEIKQAALVLADISGYTKFTRNHKMTLMHAEHIITELLEAVIDKAEFPLNIAKLEGDAVFMYALCPDEDQTAVAKDVLNQVRLFFEAFNAKAESVMATTFCTCEACSNVERLRLKAVVHHGEVAFKQIRQFEELAGENVIIVHRLIKNSIPSKEYVLLTDTFHKLAGNLSDAEPEFRTEEVEGIGPVKTAVFYVNPAEKPATKDTSIRAFFHNLPLMIKSQLVAVGLMRPAAPSNYTNLPDAA
jgi:hypothetical protein